MRRKFIILAVFFISLPCFADKIKDDIDALMHNNQLQEAKPLIKQEIDQGHYYTAYFEYLANIYALEKDYANAINTLKQGLKISENTSSSLYDSRYIMFFNLGTIYRYMENDAESEQMYSKAIESNYGYAPAYLYRLGVRTDLGKWRDAIDDCNKYLKLDPDSPQKPKILALIDMLNQKIAWDAEQKRLAEEAARLADEERRRKEEEARRLEEERQKKLLDAILSSLENASDDTKNLTAGNEDIITSDDDDDDDLAD
jgi:tetratricopeptide (TPR) repeat protein